MMMSLNFLISIILILLKGVLELKTLCRWRILQQLMTACQSDASRKNLTLTGLAITF